MAKQARGQVTRDAIIHAAGVVFANQSYSTAKLADVIEEAGVTQGALYFHFDSKHDLATELIKKQHETSIEGASAAVDEHSTGLRALVEMSRELARQMTTDPVIQGGLRLSTESSELFPEYASRPYRDWIDACQRFIDQAADEGFVEPTLDHAKLARYIMSAFTGVQVVSRALTDWADLSERLEDMWQITFRAIAAPGKQDELSELAALVRA